MLLDNRGFPCPQCGSRDNVRFFEDGPYCFTFAGGCQKKWSYENFPGVIPPEVLEKIELPDTEKEHRMAVYTQATSAGGEKISAPLELILGGEFSALSRRALAEESCEKYGIKIVHGDDPQLIFPYFDSSLNICAQKVRTLNTPKGHWRGDAKKATLFGRQAFPEPIKNRFSGVSRLCVVFGEFDAPSVWEATGVPCVSIPNGDGSVEKTIRDNYEYLNKWDEIVFVPDNDDSGRLAAKKGAHLLMRKSFIAALPADLKDANDFLVAGRGDELKKAITGAVKYTPEEVVPLSEAREALFSNAPAVLCAYPQEELQHKLGGIRRAELTTILAYPGVGKTTVCREIAYAVWKETQERIGMIFLETTEAKLIMGLVGTHLSLPLSFHNRDSLLSRDALTDAFNALTTPQRFFFTRHWGGCSSDRLVEIIEGMVEGLGCKVIFLDHISMAIIGEKAKDERIALDQLGERLKSLTNRLNINIHVVSHVNDDGSPRGSRILNQVSDNVLSLKRDLEAEDPIARNITEVTVKKCRETGLTGPAGLWFYDHDTGRLQDLPPHLISHVSKT